jgi:hypothetical protein
VTARKIPPGMDQPDSYDYEGLLRIKYREGCSISTLYALSSSNDPHYISEERQRKAAWFAKLIKKFPIKSGAHLRRIHYWLVSQSSPPLMPDGTAYKNNEDCWDIMLAASKDARYLDLVPVGAFVDRRNAEPIDYTPEDTGNPETIIERGSDSDDFGFSEDMADPPQLTLEVPEPTQRYRIEIWAEKTTMNDILLPIAEQYGCTLQTGMGEMSVTNCDDLIERTEKYDERPVRILYISDFDPAGQSMPVAVGVKIEYFNSERNLDYDIELRPVVLTPKQVKKYSLPVNAFLLDKHGQPSGRAKEFMRRFNVEGATELDALEALHPGELARIVIAEIKRFYDSGLANAIKLEADQFRHQLETVNTKVHARHAADIKRLSRQYVAWVEQAAPVWRAITNELEAETPAEPDWPEADEVKNNDDALYDSKRDYRYQTDCYKEFQDKPTSESSKPDPGGVPSDRGARTRPSHGGGRPITVSGNSKLAGKVVKVAGVGDKEASVVALLKRKWSTGADVTELTGWKGFSLPRIARKTGLTLQRKKVNGKTQYRM